MNPLTSTMNPVTKTIVATGASSGLVTSLPPPVFSHLKTHSKH